jgi:hypothetical protein
MLQGEGELSAVDQPLGDSEPAYGTHPSSQIGLS